MPARPAKIGGAPAIAKRNVATLHRSGCLACPLNTATDVITPKMGPTLASETLVYFLAEAPSENEDSVTGKPLTGPAGKLLRECVPDGEIEFCSFDNVVNCRPTKNRNPTWIEVESCRPRRWKYIEQAKPKLIVGLGLIPLHAMLGSTDMEGMRGRFFAVKVGNHTCWYMPTYHPSFILKTTYDKRKPLNSKFGHCFRADIQRAFATVGTLAAPKIETEAEIKSGIKCFEGGPGDLAPLLSLLEQARKAPTKAIDLETKGLRPFSASAAIMSAAISFDSTNISFAIDHPKAQWTRAARTQVLDAFEAVLTDKKTIKIAHNAPFEVEWLLWLFGKGIIDHTGWECTQVQAHVLDERRGKQSRGADNHRASYQGLDWLCKQHFGVAYKGLFKLDKKDMSQSPLGEMLLYGGVDTKQTLRLYNTQFKALTDKNLLETYYDTLPRQVTVALMQSLGIGVNQKAVNKISDKLGTEISVIEGKISDLDVVKKYAAATGEYNPYSPDQTVKIFRDYLNFTEVVVPEEGGRAERVSVDKNILDSIDHPLAKLILELRNKAKLKGTYVDIHKSGAPESVVYPDGLLHCNFNITFTETSRVSSDGPNLQNYPSRNDSWVRQQIYGGDGYVIIAFDYGQLEACTAAMCSKDQKLVDALWKEYDIHAEWTHKIYNRYPEIINGQSIDDPKAFKRLRSLIKNKLTFPAIFGAQNSSIAGYLKCPEQVIDDLMRDFWKEFHGLAKWQKNLMATYYNTGEVHSLNGRPRRYPLTRNQAINHPVQATAAEIVCNSMVRLSVKAVEENKWYLHPRLNIHDDLSVVVPDNDKIIEETILAYSKIMLTPPYPFINVPLSVKASVGTDWYHMEEVGEFRSDKI